MDSRVPLPDIDPIEPTAQDLEQRKRVADRRMLLDHVDLIVRPPAWAYEEIEDAIDAVIDGEPQRTIKSRDGREYAANELVENWKLTGELLAYYARPVDHPDYELDPCGW